MGSCIDWVALTGWLWGLLRVTSDFSVICINLSELITWDEAVRAFKQGMPVGNLYILQLPEQ